MSISLNSSLSNDVKDPADVAIGKGPKGERQEEKQQYSKTTPTESADTIATVVENAVEFMCDSWLKTNELYPNGVRIEAAKRVVIVIVCRGSEDFAVGWGAIALYDEKQGQGTLLFHFVERDGRLVREGDLKDLVEHMRGQTPNRPTKAGYGRYVWVAEHFNTGLDAIPF